DRQGEARDGLTARRANALALTGIRPSRRVGRPVPHDDGEGPPVTVRGSCPLSGGGASREREGNDRAAGAPPGGHRRGAAAAGPAELPDALPGARTHPLDGLQRRLALLFFELRSARELPGDRARLPARAPAA